LDLGLLISDLRSAIDFNIFAIIGQSKKDASIIYIQIPLPFALCSLRLAL
jgi:hypothetical protein